VTSEQRVKRFVAHALGEAVTPIVIQEGNRFIIDVPDPFVVIISRVRTVRERVIRVAVRMEISQEKALNLFNEVFRKKLTRMLKRLDELQRCSVVF